MGSNGGTPPRNTWLRSSGFIPLLLSFCAVIALLVGTESARAHPLGNFTLNRYARLEIYSDTLRIHYVVDMAEIPTFQELGGIDSNNDGVSAAELQQWADELTPQLLANVTLLANGIELQLIPARAQAELLPGQGNLSILRYAAVWEAPTPAANAGSDVAIVFHDANYAERAGWKELVLAPSPGAKVVTSGQWTDRSDELRAYPASSLEEAPNERSFELTWAAATGTKAESPIVRRGEATARSSGGISSLIGRELSVATGLLAILAALGFGMLHALGPGHGKTVVAAYLVGSRGRPRDALTLGLTVTATHTATVYLLGFATLGLSSLIVPEQLYLYLGIASGLMVTLFGAVIFVQRLRLNRRGRAGAHVHRHGAFGRPHSHHSNAPAALDASQHSAGERRNIVALGIAGGLLPCPSAIVVMLAAVSLGKVAFGMLLIVAFSIGLAGVLTVIGLAIVAGKRLSNRPAFARALGWPPAATALAAFPVVSAVFVTVAGAALTYQAWQQPGL